LLVNIIKIATANDKRLLRQSSRFRLRICHLYHSPEKTLPGLPFFNPTL
jgi:hypothetical protein